MKSKELNLRVGIVMVAATIFGFVLGRPLHNPWVMVLVVGSLCLTAAIALRNFPDFE